MASTKACTGCGDVLPVTAFAWKDRARGRRQPRCPDCFSTVAAEWYAANGPYHRARVNRQRRARYQANDEIIRQAKDVPCADCGGRFEAEVMDFDHVRGEKSFNIGSARGSVGPDRLRAEIAKCEVVCAACHRLRTMRRRG